ncbi:DinB family protein [Rhizobium etli]|uniref:DinB family protein n=1 Tax=Rhizobium etli TaxID=29449 RepID=UPI00093DE078|nr:DinB family protein [Rhizobium etli]
MEPKFLVLARWTVWANRCLYDACAGLAQEEYYKRRSSAFPSIHLTLNHLLATDRIWLGRLSGDGHSIPSLDYEVCPDFPSLRLARGKEDDRLTGVVQRLVEEGRPSAMLDYISMDGRPQTMRVDLVLSHLFLHHAHHRGQVHCLLSQTAVAPPSLDLTYFPREGT